MRYYASDLLKINPKCHVPRETFPDSVWDSVHILLPSDIVLLLLEHLLLVYLCFLSPPSH